MRFYILQMFLILGLSLASGYSLPDFSDSNWDTVLFLSPYGIVSNFFYETTLKSFYFDLSRGQGDLSDWRCWFVLGLCLSLLWNGRRYLCSAAGAIENQKKP